MDERRITQFCLFVMGFVLINHIYRKNNSENLKIINSNQNSEKNSKDSDGMIIEPMQTSGRRRKTNRLAEERVGEIMIEEKNSTKAYQDDLKPIIKNETKVASQTSIYDELAERNLDKFQYIGPRTKKTKLFSAYYDNRGNFGNFR